MELKVKLQEKDRALAQREKETKSLSEGMKMLQHQAQSYGKAERQSREELVVVNQNLKQQLKEREEQFSRFNDELTATQHKLATDNNQLQQQIDQLTEQLRRSQHQKDERLSNRMTTELQIKEQESQNLRNKLQMKEESKLNTQISVESHLPSQQFTTGTDGFSQSLEPVMGQPDWLQVRMY